MKRCRSPRECTHYRGVSKCLEGWKAVLLDVRTGIAAQSPVFGSERDAALAYDRMALELFDTQAVLNFVNGKVNYQAKLAHQDWTLAPRITQDLAAHLQKCAAMVPLVRQRSNSSTASAPSTASSRSTKRRRSPAKSRRSSRIKEEISEDDDGYNSSASVEAAFQELLTRTKQQRPLITCMDLDSGRRRRPSARLKLPHKLAEEVRRRRCGSFMGLPGIETPPPGSPEQRRLSRTPSTPLLRLRPIGSVDALCRHMTPLLHVYKGRPDEPHYFHALYQLTARNPSAEGFVLAAGQVLDMAMEVGKAHCAEALIASIREGHWAEIGRRPIDAATMQALASHRKRFAGTELEPAYDKAFVLATQGIAFVDGYLLGLKALIGVDSPHFASAIVEAIKESWIRA